MSETLYPAKATPVVPVGERGIVARLSPAGRALVRPEMTPADALRALARAGLYKDAFIVVGMALPLRLRMWWACLCLRVVGVRQKDAVAMDNLTAVVGWIRDPCGRTRREVARALAVNPPGERGHRLLASIAEPERSVDLLLEALEVFARVPESGAGPALYRRMLKVAIDVERGAIPLPQREV